MRRKDFLNTIAIAPFAGLLMKLADLKNITNELEPSKKMPALFIGHGNPMNALYDNAFTKHLTKVGATLHEQKPAALLVVSAHWLTQGTYVMASPAPKTIHDFGGFPEELFQVQYPAPGAPALAKETAGMITSTTVGTDKEWGLDHGAWTVLKHMFPKADIPAFQLSIDYEAPPEYHYTIASELKELRRKGVIIIGSGNIVHNLRRVDFSDDAKPFDWAVEFDTIVKTKLESRDFKSLMNYEKLGEAAKLSVPTNDHYLPMFYTLGAMEKDESLEFTFEEIQNGSVSMRCFRIG